MPIVFHQKIAAVAVAVWRIDETEEYLLSQILLTENDYRALQNFSLPKRRIERLACRNALAFLLQNCCLDIAYSATGQPVLKQGFVSFSHSGNYAAAAFSPTMQAGIDIEIISERMTRLQNRFMSPQAMIENPNLSLQEMHYHWCAKEAAYKLYGLGNIDWINNIRTHLTERCGEIFLPDKNLSYAIFCAAIEKMVLCLCYAPKTSSLL